MRCCARVLGLAAAELWGVLVTPGYPGLGSSPLIYRQCCSDYSPASHRDLFVKVGCVESQRNVPPHDVQSLSGGVALERLLEVLDNDCLQRIDPPWSR